jgi:hypothetical protein
MDKNSSVLTLAQRHAYTIIKPVYDKPVNANLNKP